jgi:hypothetical protein
MVLRIPRDDYPKFEGMSILLRGCEKSQERRDFASLRDRREQATM